MLPGGFGEGRRQLLYSLLRDARVQTTVTDIVVEFGNYRYQDLMDRFVRGDDVPAQEFRKVWEQSTVRANEPARLEELFRTVREINSGLTPDRQLRVLLGEPPIDVDNVPEPRDPRRWAVLRDSFPADLVRREVIVRGRRALVLYGQLHYLRKEILSNYDMSHWQAQTMVSWLESIPGTKVFNIWADSPGVQRIQPEAANWPAMSLVLVKGTLLGAADFTVFDNPPSVSTASRFSIRAADDFVEIPREQFKSLRMEDQFDAILYTGGGGR
jgi:hypothetical protein